MDQGQQLIECPCGTVLRGDSLSAVVEEARTHARAVHDLDLSDDDAAAVARPS